MLERLPSGVGEGRAVRRCVELALTRHEGSTEDCTSSHWGEDGQSSLRLIPSRSKFLGRSWSGHISIPSRSPILSAMVSRRNR